MEPDRLALQIHYSHGQVGKECFELFSVLMERKNTINCISAAVSKASNALKLDTN